MRKVLLDTDIYSECLKGKDSIIGEHYRAYLHEHHKLTITSCTAYEVLAGVHKNLPDKLSTYEAALANAEEITPTADDYRLAAESKACSCNRVSRSVTSTH